MEKNAQKNNFFCRWGKENGKRRGKSYPHKSGIKKWQKRSYAPFCPHYPHFSMCKTWISKNKIKNKCFVDNDKTDFFEEKSKINVDI